MHLHQTFDRIGCVAMSTFTSCGIVMQRYIVQTIYRVDISRIVSISSRKISKFRYIVIVSISVKRRRCCLFIFFL